MRRPNGGAARADGLIPPPLAPYDPREVVRSPRASRTGRIGRDHEDIPVFSLLGVLAISVILFFAVAVTARLVLGK